MTTTNGPTTHNQALGAYGERVAARYLAGLGMRVLDRNWRCDEGELDLVLRDADELVACEVKTRTTLAHGTPHEAVSAARLQRLQRLAVRWAERQGLAGVPLRVDLVAVLQPGKGRALVEHVRGIG